MKKKDIIYIFIFALISIALFFTNFKPGTFLVGWDNVMPELNFKANFTRNIFAVWQEYRGLGIEDGMAHAANLVHTIFMFFMSFILPQNVLRYFFHIFAHFLGGIGMYFLLKKFGREEKLSFVGGLFYMFNLATIQMFFAPLEVFSTHFAALPWLVLTAINILKVKNKRNITLFFLTSLVATPQGFVPTVFIAYLIVMLSIIGIELFKNGRKKIKEILIILAIIIATNAFWIFPFIHGVFTQSKVIKNAKINQMSSDEIYDKNKKRGTLTDILYLKGFMVDIAENNFNEKLVLIMKPWNDHTNQPVIFALESLFLSLVVIGLIKTFRDIKEKNLGDSAYFIPVFFISLIMLATDTPIISTINVTIRNILPLFGEAFRFPFTKFFVVYVFVYTIFLISGLEFFISKFSNLNIKKTSVLIFSFLILIYSLPAFTGNFFYNIEKIKIPQQYFEVINYFKKEDKKARIMTLPQPSFWNWTYYKWGYRGSGFLWYGIEQPMLERPFDPWSNYNEQYFNEVFYALQSENKSLLFKLVKKYNISFILIDKEFSNSNKIQNADKLIAFISSIFPESEKVEFNKLTIFKLTQKNNISIIKNIKGIGSKFNNEFIDQSTIENENYYFDKDNWDEYYLFPSLFSNKTQKDTEYDILKSDDYLIFKPKNKPEESDLMFDVNLKFNSFEKDEFYSPAVIELSNNNLVVRPLNILLVLGKTKYKVEIFKPISIKVNNNIKTIKINDKLIDLNKKNKVLLFSSLENIADIQYQNGTNIFNKVSLNFQENDIKIPSFSLTNGDISFEMEGFPLTNNLIQENKFEILTPCPEEIKDGLSTTSEENNSIILSSQYSASCFNLFLENISQQTGVVIRINSNNISGMNLKAIVDNPIQKSIIIDTKLDGSDSEKNIIVPPTSPYLYSNYGLHLRNESHGKGLSINTIEKIEVSYIPYIWLKTIKLEQKNETEPKNIYYLAQSYNPGWIAFANGKILDHVLVNNWANGWLLNNETMNQLNNGTIYIIFWPQYLEFAGFILLVFAFLRILLISQKHE